MKLIKVLSAFTAVLALSLSVQISVAKAGDCFQDPVYEYDWSATVQTGAFVRDVACMEGSVVLETVPVGATLAVTGQTDGWWRVRLADGTEGWIGDWLLSVSHTPYVASTPVTAPTTLSAGAAGAIRARTLGYILLQVEQHGEAWYVDPLTGFRYYMKDGPTAYEMMRTFGLGMTEADYAKLAAGDAGLIDRLSGRIVLRVQMHGEAYYIHPDGEVYYLADGPAAYTVMRQYSLGITDVDLAAIIEDELELIPYDSDDAEGEVLGVHDNHLAVSQYQAGATPESLDVVALNEEWLRIMNTERTERGVAPLVLDQRLVDTAANWSAYIGGTGNFTHNRPYGESLSAWFGGFNYDFKPQGSFDGWRENAVGENLVLVFAENSQTGLEGAIHDALDLFMAEEIHNGMHFQNVVNTDWNTTGLGIYLNEYSPDYFQVYLVTHFASLER